MYSICGKIRVWKTSADNCLLSYWQSPDWPPQQLVHMFQAARSRSRMPFPFAFSGFHLFGASVFCNYCKQSILIFFSPVHCGKQRINAKYGYYHPSDALDRDEYRCTLTHAVLCWEAIYPTTCTGIIRSWIPPEQNGMLVRVLYLRVFSKPWYRVFLPNRIEIRNTDEKTVFDYS
jgi:hypothetical protein